MNGPAIQGTLGLTDLRERAAAILQPAAPADPGVLSELVVFGDVPDAIDPPVLLILWRQDPWLEPFGRCTYWAQLTVMAVASRLDPAPGIEALEQLVAYVLGRFQHDAYSWGGPTITAPRNTPIGNLNYLAAEITYRVAVSTEED
jgi:hypothetical protein